MNRSLKDLLLFWNWGLAYSTCTIVRLWWISGPLPLYSWIFFGNRETTRRSELSRQPVYFCRHPIETVKKVPATGTSDCQSQFSSYEVQTRTVYCHWTEVRLYAVRHFLMLLTSSYIYKLFHTLPTCTTTW